MKPAAERPRVLVGMPGDQIKAEAAISHYGLASRGAVEIIPVMAIGVLTQAHNSIWAQALNLSRAGIVTHCLIHHTDIEIRTHGWLDLMVAEMEQHGAAILSVVQPIKTGSGASSTAIEGEDRWHPRKLTIDECYQRPGTWTEPGLLVNTGLLLVDVRRPEFWEMDAEKCLCFYFTMQDRVKLEGEKLMPLFKPEDWNFSRMCHARDLPVYATTKIECVHYGWYGFSNRPTALEDDKWFDFADVYREAVERTPRKGYLVEVGCWKGRSLRFLLQEAKRADKQLTIFGVDHFKGSPNQPAMMRVAQAEDLERICLEVMDEVDYDYCELISLPSLEAKKKFADRTVDFVFIDTAHDYQSVRSDIRAWLPKVKTHGVLAGHDYDPSTDPEVVQAVNDSGLKIQIKGRCWWHEVGV